jgi:hypothetical protein
MARRQGLFPKTQTQIYREHRESGKCVRCGKPAIPERCMCSGCAIVAAQKSRAYKSKMVEESRCYYCGEPFTPRPISNGKMHLGCDTCREFNARKRSARRSAIRQESAL